MSQGTCASAFGHQKRRYIDVMQRPFLFYLFWCHSAVKQLQQARKRRQEQSCKQQPRQHQFWLQRVLADAGTTRPAIKVPEDASWSDLRVHAICAVVSLGGHQLLRMLQKKLRRRGDHTHRHSRRASSRQIGNSIGAPRFASSAAETPDRGRRNSSTGRFL